MAGNPRQLVPTSFSISSESGSFEGNRTDDSNVPRSFRNSNMYGGSGSTEQDSMSLVRPSSGPEGEHQQKIQLIRQKMSRLSSADSEDTGGRAGSSNTYNERVTLRRPSSGISHDQRRRGSYSDDLLHVRTISGEKKLPHQIGGPFIPLPSPAHPYTQPSHPSQPPLMHGQSHNYSNNVRTGSKKKSKSNLTASVEISDPRSFSGASSNSTIPSVETNGHRAQGTVGGDMEESSRASNQTSDSSDIQNFTSLLNNMHLSSTLEDSDLYLERGEALYEEGRSLEAIEMFKRALPLEMMRHQDVNHVDVAKIRVTLGGIYGQMGKYHEALDELKEALKIYRAHESSLPLDVASTLNIIGVAYKKIKDFKRAKQYFRDALDLRVRVLGQIHVDVAISCANVGSIYMSMKKYKKAIDYYVMSLKANDEARRKRKADITTAKKLFDLGHQALYNEDYISCEKAAVSSKDTYKRILGNDHPDLIGPLELLYLVYQKLDKSSNANIMINHAKYIRKIMTTNASSDTNIIVDSLTDRRKNTTRK
mmetsp:Transcript_6496/g.8557  ORF Transcript_6496/g.8557 Transcript_6496/m.8557 type:complete len:536 (-) Transcript_6496:65-1672(-)